MSPRLGVLIIHGMGAETRTFADAISADLTKRLEDKGIAKGTVFFCPLFWAEVLEPAETKLLETEQNSGNLAWMDVRRFVMHNLADATAYRRTDNEPGGVYN